MNGYLFTFVSTHDGIAVRKALRDKCAFTVLPTPRSITKSCGISVLVPDEGLPAALEILRGLGIDGDRAALYRALEQNGEKIYEQVTL